MLILHDESGLIEGLQTFPKTSDQPHIVVDDSLFEQLKPLVGIAQLISGDDGFELPPDWAVQAGAAGAIKAEAALIAEVQSAVQQHLDAAARAAGYDDIRTAVTYADEPSVPKFQSEGQAFRAWRSLCWDYCYAQLAAVKANDRSQPTLEEFISELPAITLTSE